MESSVRVYEIIRHDFLSRLFFQSMMQRMRFVLPAECRLG